MANQNIEKLMQEVIDREAIRSLPLHYCHCVWQKDLDGYVNLFTEDGVISATDPSLPRAQGREALRKMISNGLDDMKPQAVHPQPCDRTTGSGSCEGDVLCRGAHEPRR